MYKLALALPFLLLFGSQPFFTRDGAAPPPKPACQMVWGSGEVSTEKGNVAVTRANNGNVVVILDSADSTGAADGVPDVVYRFAPTREDLYRYSHVSFNLKQGQVIFRPGRLLVMSRDDRVVVGLSVEEIPEGDAHFATFGDVSRDLPNTVRLNKGIGLAREVPALSDEALRGKGFKKSSKVSRLLDLVALETAVVISKRDVRAADDGGGGSAPPSCSSGGVGATTCSVTCSGGSGCSVTCGTGYWPCCNCGNCACKDKADFLPN